MCVCQKHLISRTVYACECKNASGPCESACNYSFCAYTNPSVHIARMPVCTHRILSISVHIFALVTGAVSSL